MSGTVSFLLGAGFSAPFKVPTMRPFLESFRNFALRKYPRLETALKNHLAKLESDGDIESLLSSLSKAEELDSALPSFDHMNSELKQWADDSRSIKAHLVSYIIERCEQFDREQAEEEIVPLLNRLNHSKTLSEVHFFTTNYDRIMEYVTEYADIALDDGFGESKNDSVAPWTREFKNKFRLYKLHGSVTYYVDRQSAPSNEFLRLDRGYPLPDPDFRLSRQGRALEPLMVLPALEKEAMDDPYGYLTHIFTETLSKGGLLVTMGTSLRDVHLVSAMNYSSEKIVVLVIDTDPEAAIRRIPELRSVGLKANSSEFLTVSYEPLAELAERCAALSCTAKITEELHRFSAEQGELIRARRAMTDEQKDLVDVLRGPDNYIEKIEAMRNLQGLSHAEVIEAISALLIREPSSEVRKAAAGYLGLSKSPKAVEGLANVATHDASPDVRLESYLALREIGDADARRALDSARSTWPGDPFFWEDNSA